MDQLRREEKLALQKGNFEHGKDPLTVGDQGTVTGPDENDESRLQVRFGRGSILNISGMNLTDFTFANRAFSGMLTLLCLLCEYWYHFCKP